MTLGEEDAASALAAVARARRRSFELKGYAHSGGTLIVWGLVWLVCNLATWFLGGAGGMAWPIGVAIGTIFSIANGRGMGKGGVKGDWRAFASVGTLFGTAVLLTLIAGIDSPAQGNALISLFVAASYVTMGIWVGPRFAAIGLVLAAMVCAGWFADRAHLELWLGVGGGGALIVTGIWLRRA